MEFIKRHFIALLALAAALGVGVQHFMGHAAKIGYVNARALIEAHPGAEDVQRQIRQKNDEYQANLNALAAQLDSLAKDYGKIRDAKTKEAAAAFIRQKGEDLGRYRQEGMEKIRILQADLFKPIINGVNLAVKEYAASHSVDIIIGQVPDNFIYGREGLDMTHAVSEAIKKGSTVAGTLGPKAEAHAQR